MSSAAATIAQTFEQHAGTYGARPFLKDKYQKAWRNHSWIGISNREQRLRGGLIRIGIAPGDRVAILAENGPHWVVFDMAVLGLGAAVVPLYTTSGLEETRHVIADSGARLIGVYGDAMVEKVRGLGEIRFPVGNISAKFEEVRAVLEREGIVGA